MFDDLSNSGKSKAARHNEQFFEKLIIENSLLTCEKPLDVEGIAQFLGKKPNTIRNWVSSGRVKIPHFWLGNKVMFFRSSVVEWCRSLERENKPLW